MTVEEYHTAQLWSVAEASKNETGGGDGLEVLVNTPFDEDSDPEIQPPEQLEAGGKVYTRGQYTHKKYHLQSKVPAWVRALAPKGSLEMEEKAWNAYPYCRTVISNPDYMKDGFYIIIESFHAQDRGEQENVHQLTPEELAVREVHRIDIVNSKVQPSDYRAEWDPALFKSEKTGRGPLRKDKDFKDDNRAFGSWVKDTEPAMCCYKLVRVLFKWWGLQNKVEKFILRQERRLFTNFHRQVFCWIDKWYGLTMEDIRAIEEKTKAELDEQRSKGPVRGTVATKDDKDE